MFVGLLLSALLSASLLTSIIVGVVVFSLVIYLAMRYQGARFVEVTKSLKVLYPSAPEQKPH